MMKSSLLSAAEIGARTKICCASVLLSILIFSGTAYAQQCNEDNTTWGFIKDIAGKSIKLIDGLDSVGSQDQLSDAIGLASESADKQDIDCLMKQISLGFRDVRWATAKDIIGEAQDLVFTTVNRMQTRSQKKEKVLVSDSESDRWYYARASRRMRS